MFSIVVLEFFFLLKYYISLFFILSKIVEFFYCNIFSIKIKTTRKKKRKENNNKWTKI